MTKSFGIYIHWPYCLSKCPYCDFFSLPSTRIDETLFLNRYIQEIQCLPKGSCVTSIFFGGGTPSLMSCHMIETILSTLSDNFILPKDIEISLEVNPDAISFHKMKCLNALGINRLSIGVQALDAPSLRFLGRRHSLETAHQCIQDASSVFQNLSIDLIYARPNQTWEMWEKELDEALQYHLPHYSLYELTIEDDTPFARRAICSADEETSRQLFLKTMGKMDLAGVPLYEVSNFALHGFECHHNQAYWQSHDYVGIGPSAHGRLGKIATENPKNINDWLNGKQNVYALSDTEKQEERILMGLRQKEGITDIGIHKSAIQKALDYQWITYKNGQICPTQKGFVMLNQLILLLI